MQIQSDGQWPDIRTVFASRISAGCQLFEYAAQHGEGMSSMRGHFVLGVGDSAGNMSRFETALANWGLILKESSGARGRLYPPPR